MDLSGQHLLSIKELYNCRKKTIPFIHLYFSVSPLSREAQHLLDLSLCLKFKTMANKMISRQGKNKNNLKFIVDVNIFANVFMKLSVMN